MLARYYQSSPSAEEIKAYVSLITKSVWTRPRANLDKPLVLYGAGNLGAMAAEYFSSLSISVKNLYDADPAGIDPERFENYDITVAPLSTAGSSIKSEAILVVCIANCVYSSLRAELLSQGWRDVRHFYEVTNELKDQHPLSNGWTKDHLTERDISELEACMAHWEDDRSRSHHLQFIAWHLLSEEWSFEDAPIQFVDRYFIPEVRSVLSSHESFVDVGTHHGESITAFHEAVCGSFKDISAFEPDPANRAIAQERLGQLALKPDDCKMWACALSDDPGERPFFYGGGYASQLWNKSEHVVEVRRLDDMQLKPSVLKLHIEGAELAALKGAARTLQTFRPIVMATVYHDSQGIHEVARWLESMLHQYRFYFRLHAGAGTGAVVYAIPSERQAKVPGGEYV